MRSIRTHIRGTFERTSNRGKLLLGSTTTSRPPLQTRTKIQRTKTRESTSKCCTQARARAPQAHHQEPQARSAHAETTAGIARKPSAGGSRSRGKTTTTSEHKVETGTRPRQKYVHKTRTQTHPHRTTRKVAQNREGELESRLELGALRAEPDGKSGIPKSVHGRKPRHVHHRVTPFHRYKRPRRGPQWHTGGPRDTHAPAIRAVQAGNTHAVPV